MATCLENKKEMKKTYSFTWKDFWLGVLGSFILLPIVLGYTAQALLRHVYPNNDIPGVLAEAWFYMVLIGFVLHLTRWWAARKRNRA